MADHDLLPQVAAKRCGKVFTKTPSKPATQRSKSSRTRQAKIESKDVMDQQEPEPLSDRERQDMMVQWAVNSFKPSGPKGFAPSEGTVLPFSFVQVLFCHFQSIFFFLQFVDN